MEKKILKKKTQSSGQKVKPQAKPKTVKAPRTKRSTTVPLSAGVIGLHNLKRPRGAAKEKKILGRGPSSGHGKTSTRGSKGQTSRAGRHFYAGFEGGQTSFIRRIAKRGFTSNFRKEYQVVNLDSLKKIKETDITLSLLETNGLIRDKNRPVKILGNGELKHAVNIQAHAFSKSAAEKILKSGGKIETINDN